MLNKVKAGNKEVRAMGKCGGGFPGRDNVRQEAIGSLLPIPIAPFGDFQNIDRTGFTVTTRVRTYIREVTMLG
jgi:hypothetical protein